MSRDLDTLHLVGMLNRVAALLRNAHFRFSSEAELQRGIAQVLQAEGIPFESEVALSDRERIDFLIAGELGLEVKIKGSTSDLQRQLGRYAEIDSTARWPAPTVRTWDGNRVEPRLEALILGLIVAEWEANEAAVGPQQGVLL